MQVAPVHFPLRAQPEERLSVGLPRHQYKSVKVVPVPFDPRLSDNGRFDSIDQAMTFVAKHCFMHHSQFTKSLAKMYLPFCRVLSFAHGGYVEVDKVMKREFEAAFAAAQRKVKL